MKPEREPMVFSVRRVYAQRILSEEKTREYRKQRPRLYPGEMILIYETAPTSAIVCEVLALQVIEGTPAELWDEESGGIERADYDAYYEGRERAYAILLHRPRKVGAVKLPEGMAAPQRWSRFKGPPGSWVRARGWRAGDADLCPEGECVHPNTLCSRCDVRRLSERARLVNLRLIREPLAGPVRVEPGEA